MSSHSKRIIALDVERMQAMVNINLAKLNGMLCKDMFYNHFNLRVDNKQSLLDSFETGVVTYKSIEQSEVKTMDLVDVVVLIDVAEFDIDAVRAILIVENRSSRV